jgi:hypothetical protein
MGDNKDLRASANSALALLETKPTDNTAFFGPWSGYTTYSLTENGTELGVLLAIQVTCFFLYFQKVHGRPMRAEMFF